MRRMTIAALVAATSALGISTSAAGATSLPPGGPTDPALPGAYRAATDSAATFPDYHWTGSHVRMVDLPPWDTAELYALKAANPNVKVLMYQNASAVSNTPDSTGIYPTGVSYDQAAANGWLLDNTSGQPIQFQGYPWLYAADIGSSSYQQAWASNVIKLLGSAPWDGVMLDDVNPTIQYHYCVSCVAKYPSDAQYGQAMKSFLANVGPQLMATGKLAIANIGSWSAYNSVTNPWLEYLSGAEDEEFVKWGDTPNNGYQDPTGWANELNEIKLAASEGKAFIGITHSDNGDAKAAVYGYATELLAGNANSLFYMGADYTNQTWFPEYDYNLGTPTGTYTELPSGVYERAFTNGLAVVNPTTATQRVSLGGTYSGSGLANATTATMRPQTGLVLTGQGNPLAIVASKASRHSSRRHAHARRGSRHTRHAVRHRHHRRHHRRHRRRHHR